MPIGVLKAVRYAQRASGSRKDQSFLLRSSSADEALRLSPKKVLSLEQALEFIDTDELLEVTPKNLRIRKKILDSTLRKRDMINRKNAVG